MKPPAQFLGLLFATLSVTALAVDTPPQPATAPAPVAEKPAGPAVTPAAEVATPAKEAAPAADLPAAAPAKAEPAVSPPDAPLNFTPLAHPKPEDNKPADPNTLELPKMVVKQKPRPRLTPEVMVTKQGLGEQLAKQKYSALDQALNKFTIPLFGTSMATRALEDYEREKKAQMTADVLNLSKAVEQTDPAEAKALRDATTKP